MSAEQGGWRIDKELDLGSERLNAAYKLAQDSHEGQKRKSGEPYFEHCVSVFKIFRDEWKITDENCLMAALLHDTVEDTNISIKQIQLEFGDEVASLVEGVTKLETNTDHETLKKVLDKSNIDPRVALLKLADRLHNMRTLDSMPRKNQIKKAQETRDVYTKLAESLGMWVVKTELEDLAFKYLDTDDWEKMSSIIKDDPRLSPDFSCYLRSRIEQTLGDKKIKGEVETRNNGIWFLKKKQEKLALKGKGSPEDLNDINDVISFRIKVKSLEDCYQVLKEIHQDFGGMVDYDRFDEFIGENKQINGYQAIQTTIDFPNVGSVEVAIMTDEMEQFNNWGVISLINKQNDLKDYVLKLVFTPSRSVRFLPKNATGVDFAAAIGPKVLTGADSIFVDGVENPVSMVIPNATTIRVNLSESTRRAPLAGLENYCLPQTRKIIEELRILEERDNLAEQGQKILEAVLIPRGLLVLTDVGDSINPILYELGCQGIDDLCFKLGKGIINNELINKKLDEAGITKEKLHLTTIRLRGKDHSGILIDIVNLVNETGKNITNINNKKDKKGMFDLRILVENLSKEEEENIKGHLETDQRFSEKVVV